MTRLSGFLIAFCLVCTPALAADKRIFKIDSVIATAKGDMVTVQASGAVRTGGWKLPRLHLLHNDGHVATVEFVAVPPPPDMTVIEALVPLSASLQIHVHHGIDAVRVVADANDMTSQVLH